MRFLWLACVLTVGCNSSATKPEGLLVAADPARLDSIAGLRVYRDGDRVHGVQALDHAVLVADDASREPAARATSFLARYGGVVGLSAAERAALDVQTRDVIAPDGTHYVRVGQLHHGLPVFGGELVVELTGEGVTAATGSWVTGITAPTTARIARDRARDIATGAAAKLAKVTALDTLAAKDAVLAIYKNHLAWRVDVGGSGDGFAVWVDATAGGVLDAYRTTEGAKFRIAYEGSYTADTSSNPFTPGPTAVCREDQLNGGVTCTGFPATLYRFSGQVYDFYNNAFARDSYDGGGAKMRTVNLVNQQCPNAYWDGTTTNYCPDFELDDVVAHEWSHAYTQYVDNLVYAYQSGALNESYSDIFGETIDLHNGEDGVGGNANDAPPPAGVRWVMGEDFASGNGEYELLLRDMWDPDRLSYPGKVTSENYECGTGDGGGVHTNSSVTNHMYALLVDGTAHPATCDAQNPCIAPLACNTTTSKCEYNGQSINAIGFVKAAAIYWKAKFYQNQTTTFPQHADALDMACAALTGQALPGWGGHPGDTITAADCAEVTKAATAVELRTPPNCGFEPMLKPNPPAACRGAAPLFSETWANGLAGWTTAHTGTAALQADASYNWQPAATKPAGKPGKAAFAPDSKGGTCTGDGDYSGSFTLDSPTLTAPAANHKIELRFEHFVETELGYDGGQLLISVNGGAFQLVPNTAYEWNGPTRNFEPPLPTGQNTNPNAGEPAWTGADGGASTGSWGTTVVDLSGLVAAGQTYKLRFEFSIDGCNGVTGWYLGDLVANDCPPLPGPTLSLGSDYTNPDPDGSYTLQWTRPTASTASPTGPDELQESRVSCAPALAENADGSLAKWSATMTGTATSGWGTGVKPNHATNVFRVTGIESNQSAGDSEATITTVAPITIPAGAKATLRFEQWYANEPDDRGFVEVSDDAGATWREIYKNDRAIQAPGDNTAFTSEAMEQRTLKLDNFAGKNILVRFRYFVGAANYFFYTPNGWYLDNIAVDVDQWVTLVDANVTSKLVSGKANGTYCYRVRTTHTIGTTAIRSDFSNVVIATVNQASNPLDTDMDSIVDTADNCVTTPNTDQKNSDGDAKGDACDPCFGASNTDADTDGRCDEADNCPQTANPTQADSDGDGKGDACDCGAGEDADGDNVCNLGDNCPNMANPTQTDADGDGIGDACDPCLGTSNVDPDGDRLCSEGDNCPDVGNADQTDTDSDGIGDACDCTGATDMDGDGACNPVDNCPTVANADQKDDDDDSIGDVCDPCAGFPNTDEDHDMVCDSVDNCLGVANTDQADADGDHIGDACCPDADSDGICDAVDECPDTPSSNGKPCFADDGGCGCHTNGSPAGALPFVLVALFLMRRRRSAALLAMLVVAAPAARADDHAHDVQVGGFLLGFHANKDHEFYDYMATTQVPLGTIAPGAGARVAVFPLSFLGFEVEGEYLRASTASRDSVNLYGFGAHVIGQLPGRVRPFGVVGAGAMGVRSSSMDLGNDADAVGYGGVGVAFDLTDTIALRADGRYLRGPRANSDGAGTNHFSFGIGVSGMFGGSGHERSKPLEAPPPPVPVVVEAEPPPPPPAPVDTDGDRYTDDVDKCRDEAEDFDQFQDEDGCPDPDNDTDGVMDKADRCPIVAGPLENAGCPDTDRDGDTVVDRIDNCPDEAGSAANHGCKAKQLVVITPTKLQILDRVYFATNSAKLLPKSNKLLDNIARVLLAHPELGKVRIEGHTDDRGDEAYNLDLSQKRAEAVRAYLVKKKVGEDRLEAKGFGKTQPIDPSTTNDARAANRRVEFNIVTPAAP